MKIIILLLLPFFAFAQVGIGTINPHKSSVLEVSSQNKGFLPPRLTIANRNSILNPAAGLTIYCENCCEKGVLSFYNGTVWKNITDCTIENDNDNDGVPESDDLDWDNDGIKNSLESNETSFSTIIDDGLVYNGSSNGIPSSIEYEILKIENKFNLSFYEGATQKKIHLNYSSFQLNYNVSLNTSDIYLTTDGNSPSISNKIENPGIENANGLARLKIIIDIDGKVTFIATQQVSSTHYIEVVPSDGTVWENLPLYDGLYLVVNPSNSGADQMSIKQTFYYNDNDGDGIENARDLDSDNDGCSDALEAGLTTSTIANFSFSTFEAGQNGLADTLENGDTGNYKIAPNTSAPYNDVIHTCN